MAARRGCAAVHGAGGKNRNAEWLYHLRWPVRRCERFCFMEQDMQSWHGLENEGRRRLLDGALERKCYKHATDHRRNANRRAGCED